MRGRGQAGSGLGQPPLLRPRIGAKWWQPQAAPGFGPPRLISPWHRAGRPRGPCFPQGRARAARGRTRCGRATGCTRRCPGSSSRRRRRCCRARSFEWPAGRSKRRPAAAATMGHCVRPASLAGPPQGLRPPPDAERSGQRVPPRASRGQCRLRWAVAHAHSQAAHRPMQAAPVARDAKPPRALVPAQPWCQKYVESGARTLRAEHPCSAASRAPPGPQHMLAARRQRQNHRQGRRHSGWRTYRAATGRTAGLPREQAAAVPCCWR